MMDNTQGYVHIVVMASIADSAVRGTQVVSRVSAVLRALAGDAPAGVTTSAVAASAGLTRPTAHRLLSALLDEGLADRDSRSGRWFLGPEMYILGTLAAPRFDVSEQAADCVRQLAADTGESAFFSVRR